MSEQSESDCSKVTEHTFGSSSLLQQTKKSREKTKKKNGKGFIIRNFED